ncbi:MAG: hypothetical protein AB2A00_08630 [Myxococcota bacterium]
MHALFLAATLVGAFKITMLEPLPGGSHCLAADINDRGWVVGQSEGTGGRLRASLWIDPNEPIDLFGSDPDDVGAAVDISETGVVVGFVMHASIPHAFVWEDGVFVDIHEAARLDPTRPSQAFAVNDEGVVVGQADFGAGNRGFVWKDGALQELSGLTRTTPSAGAVDINNAGEIVGVAGVVVGPETFPRAVVWTLLDSTISGPVEIPIGAVSSIPRAINARGDVIGTATFGPDTYAFLFRNDIVLTDTLGGTSLRAPALNNAGRGVFDGQPGGVGPDEGYLWDGTTRVKLCPACAGLSTVADVNDDEQVVGTAQIGSLVPTAYLWSSDRGPRAILSDNSDATGINALGLIIGDRASGTAGDRLAFIACEDDDQDGVCNSADACPNTQGDFHIDLATHRLADTDGDGVFEVRLADGSIIDSTLTLEDTNGCSCTQLVLTFGLPESFSSEGCPQGALASSDHPLGKGRFVGTDAMDGLTVFGVAAEQ